MVHSKKQEKSPRRPDIRLTTQSVIVLNMLTELKENMGKKTIGNQENNV